MRLDRLARRAIDGRAIPGQFQSHQPAPAAQRSRGQCVVKPRRVAVDVRLGQEGDVERIIRMGGGGLGQPVGALMHSGAVAAMDQRAANRLWRLSQKAFDLRAFGEDHGRAAPYFFRARLVK